MTDENEKYYLCVSSNANNPKKNENEDEWNIVIEKKRSFGQRLSGKGKILRTDKIVQTSA